MTPIRRKRERGNAALEMAIVFPVLWLVFAGTFQMGYAMYAYNLLSDASASGAAFASRLSYSASNPSAFTTAVKNFTVYGDPAGGTAPAAPNLATSQVNVTLDLDGAGVPRSVSVGISSYSVNAIFTSYTFTNKPLSTMRWMGMYLV